MLPHRHAKMLLNRIVCGHKVTPPKTIIHAPKCEHRLCTIYETLMSSKPPPKIAIQHLPYLLTRPMFTLITPPFSDAPPPPPSPPAPAPPFRPPPPRGIPFAAQSPSWTVVDLSDVGGRFCADRGDSNGLSSRFLRRCAGFYAGSFHGEPSLPHKRSSPLLTPHPFLRHLGFAHRVWNASRSSVSIAHARGFPLGATPSGDEPAKPAGSATRRATQGAGRDDTQPTGQTPLER